MKTLKKLFSPKNDMAVIYFLGAFAIGKFFLNIFEVSENVQTIFISLFIVAAYWITVKGVHGEK